MTETQSVCFKIIASVGGARSLCIEAMQEAQKAHFDHAEALLQEAESLRQKAHEDHFALLSKESRGEAVDLSLLLIHSEDLLINAEVLQLMASELLVLQRRVHGLEAK